MLTSCKLSSEPRTSDTPGATEAHISGAISLGIAIIRVLNCDNKQTDPHTLFRQIDPVTSEMSTVDLQAGHDPLTRVHAAS